MGNIFGILKCWKFHCRSEDTKLNVTRSVLIIIRTICHAWDLWKLAQSCKQLCLLCLPDPWNLPDTALLSGFRSSQWFEIYWVRQYLTPGFNGLGKDNYKTRRETSNFGDLLCLILEVWWYRVLTLHITFIIKSSINLIHCCHTSCTMWIPEYVSIISTHLVQFMRRQWAMAGHIASLMSYSLHHWVIIIMLNCSNEWKHSEINNTDGNIFLSEWVIQFNRLSRTEYSPVRLEIVAKM